MDRMSAMDAMFYYMEGENTPMHVGGVAVLDGPPPAYGDLVRLLVGKLDRVPRYRQVVREVPFSLGRPVWVDDPHFQILYHVRHTSIPQPGGDEQLRNLAGRVFAQRLDMGKPVWECWLVEGLADGRWALINKAHHCMIDGVASTDLMQVIFDLEPDPVRGEPIDWHPAPLPSSLTMATESIMEAVQSPMPLLFASSWTGLSKVRQSVTGIGMAVKALVPQLAPGPSAPTPASFNGSLGPHRRWVWTDASLGDVKAIRREFGGTINDVVLTAITRGYRDLIESRGELVPGMVVRSLVPVSTRRPEARGRLDNQVSAVLVDLPVSENDPERRLEAIRTQMDRNKRGLVAVDAAAIVGLADYAAPTLLVLGTRASSILPQNLIQTGTTNVPGPRVPLYLLGRQLVESHPYVPVFAGVRVAVGILSYLDRFSFGITADFDSFPDVELISAGIGRGFEELLARVEAATAAPAPATAPERARPALPAVKRAQRRKPDGPAAIRRGAGTP